MRLYLECRIPDISGNLELRPTNEAAGPRLACQAAPALRAVCDGEFVDVELF